MTDRPLQYAAGDLDSEVVEGMRVYTKLHERGARQDGESVEEAAERVLSPEERKILGEYVATPSGLDSQPEQYKDEIARIAKAKGWPDSWNEEQ